MLVPTVLADSLANSWLPGNDGPYPGSLAESADAFATAVAGWFALAQAAGFPNVTAQARRPMLLGLAIPALSAGAAVPAGQQLAVAVMSYMAGQIYGAGVAAPSTGTGAAGAMMGSAFAARDLDRQSRAQMIATALHLMALTSLVSFPHPPFVAPVL